MLFLKSYLEKGRQHKIEVVPGVEISIRFKRSFFTGTLHLLCYFSPVLLKDEDFRKELEATLGMGRGEELVRARVREINRFFGPKGEKPVLLKNITFEEISEYSSNVTRRHFALALDEKHHIDDPGVINSIIGNNSPAYVPSGIDLDTAEKFLKKFPVISVLAHPAAGSFPGKGHYSEGLPPIETVEKLFPEFIDAGRKGLEINYLGHIQKHREILYGWAEKYDLVVTGGSDCHDAVNRAPGVEGITEKEFNNFKRMLNVHKK